MVSDTKYQNRQNEQKTCPLLCCTHDIRHQMPFKINNFSSKSFTFVVTLNASIISTIPRVLNLHAAHSAYIFLWRLCTGRLAGLEMWGGMKILVWHNKQAHGTECTYPTLLKVEVNVSCTLNKFVSVKNSEFLGIKKPKTLGLSKQPEQGISELWPGFCLCSRLICTSSCTQVLEWVEKIVSAAFVTCFVKDIVNSGTKHFGCANSHP